MYDEKLWRAVVLQAFQDSTMHVSEPKPGADNSRRFELATKAREREEARAWLLNGGPDFHAVCAMADLEPERVRQYAMALLSHA